MRRPSTRLKRTARLEVTSAPDCSGTNGGLLREAIEDVDELGQPPALLRLALGDPVGHARLDVMLEHGEADAVEGGLGGGKLLQDVDADARLLHHATDAADLPFDAIEAGDEASVAACRPAWFPRGSAAALTLYAAIEFPRGCRARNANHRHTLFLLRSRQSRCAIGLPQVALDRDLGVGSTTVTSRVRA